MIARAVPLLDRHSRFAIGAFYLFTVARGFADAYGSVDAIEGVSRAGVASAAVMWWAIDGMRRRADVPFASLWLGFFWMFTLPIHLLTTRPRRHALIAITKHMIFVALATLFGASLGAHLSPL
jgi:hypothetical protein